MLYINRCVFCFAFSLASLGLYAQAGHEKCACCTENHRQFDFWIGDWIVYDTLGNEVGKNKIERIQKGCVLLENWASENMTGTSFNHYDSQEKSWNQLWLDSNGSKLELKGSYDQGVMIMRSDLLKGQKIAEYYNQISWSQAKDGSVIQIWEIYDKKNNLLKTIFHGIYKK